MGEPTQPGRQRNGKIRRRRIGRPSVRTLRKRTLTRSKSDGGGSRQSETRATSISRREQSRQMVLSAVTEFTAFGRDAIAQLSYSSSRGVRLIFSVFFSPLPVQKTSVAPHGGDPCSAVTREGRECSGTHARASESPLLLRVGVPSPLSAFSSNSSSSRLEACPTDRQVQILEFKWPCSAHLASVFPAPIPRRNISA